MEVIVDMYQPEALNGKVAFVFKDQFSDLTFEESVEKNNLDLAAPRPYSIQNSHPDG